MHLIDDLKKLFTGSVANIWYHKGDTGNYVSGLAVETHKFHVGINVEADSCTGSIMFSLREKIILKIKQAAAKYNLNVSFTESESVIEINCFRIRRG